MSQLEHSFRQKFSVMDVYISILTKSNPFNLKDLLLSYKAGDPRVNADWIQLHDLVSESKQYLGFQGLVMSHMVSVEPELSQLKALLRWHDIAVWMLVYNLNGNEFDEMEHEEKYVYSTILKLCCDIGGYYIPQLTSELYQK